MKKARTLLIIAIWVAILPYLGFPYFWKNLMYLITGIAIAYISYIIYREAKPKETTQRKTFDSFSENFHHKKHGSKNFDIKSEQNLNAEKIEKTERKFEEEDEEDDDDNNNKEEHETETAEKIND
ncbi:MAG TPA: hypothetical protein PLO44_02310 [Candidatus Paceibacterota bacterium]|nr:hypothetical protein [Candidatus Paceibacterota bacterium]